MKKISQDPLFCGVLAFQLAAFAFVCGQSWGQSLPLSVIGNSLNGTRIEVGSSWPQFAAYDQIGARREIFEMREDSAIILKSTCSCEDNQVSNWLVSERQAKEQVTLVMPFDKKEAKEAVARNGWTGRILRVRRIELERLGLIQEGKPKQLPLMVHLDANGVILGVQTSQ